MEKEQTTSIKIGLFVLLVVVVVAVVFMLLFFMKPLMEKNKVKDDLQKIIKEFNPNLTDDQAKCLANKSADGSNAQQIVGEIGSLCAAAEIASLLPTPVTPIPTPVTPIPIPVPFGPNIGPNVPVGPNIGPVGQNTGPKAIKVPDMCKNYLPKFQNANSWAKDCNVGGV